MLIRIFKTRDQAMRFIFPFIKKGRIAGVRNLKSGKWEAKLLARR